MGDLYRPPDFEDSAQPYLPFKRPPYQVLLIEESLHRSILIDSQHFNRIDNERWMVHTEIEKPRLNERYILQWDW